LPDFVEKGGSRFTIALVLLHEAEDALVEPVHGGIGMLPGVAEGGLVERRDHLPDFGKLQQAGAGGDEEADGILDWGHVAYEIQLA
jgi:hypothetical protein